MHYNVPVPAFLSIQYTGEAIHHALEYATATSDIVLYFQQYLQHGDETFISCTEYDTSFRN